MKFIVSKSSWYTKEDGENAPCEGAKLEKVVTILNQEISVWTVEYASLENVLALISNPKSPPILLDRTSVKEIPYCIVIYDDVSDRTISDDTLANIPEEVLASARDLRSEEECPQCGEKVRISSYEENESGTTISYIEHCNNMFFVGVEGKYLGEQYDVNDKTKKK